MGRGRGPQLVSEQILATSALRSRGSSRLRTVVFPEMHGHKILFEIGT